MDDYTRNLLMRWRSFESGSGMKLVTSMARFLWFVGLALCAIVVFGVMYGLHSAAIAGAAIALGWVIAERNALRSRQAQWPIFKQYIDWQKVQKDLGESNSSAEP
jgi:hypothetical protein